MSESIRVSGKTVNDAIMNAAIELSTTSDQIEYTVIEKESKGFLGIGARDAVIEAKVKEAEAEKTGLQPEKKEESSDQKASFEKTTSEQKASFEKATSEQKVSFEKATSEQKGDGEERSAREERRYSDIRVLEDPSEAIERAETFLKNVFASMNMEVAIKSNYDGEYLNVSMEGTDMGLLIGKRGQTLDSLQYLTSLVVNKGKPYYVRVKLDTENYRDRRKATLENLAKNISIKVKKTRQPVYLEPMNPYERRIIHSALQGDPFVTTHSEGEEPDRKVVVTLKKDADLELLERKYGDRSRRYGGRGGQRSSRYGRGYGHGSRRYEDREERSYTDYENGRSVEAPSAESQAPAVPDQVTQSEIGNRE